MRPDDCPRSDCPADRPAGRIRRAASGFTIVELLVVVGIIALLVGITLPALSGARARARKTVEINDIRNVGQGWLLYATQSDDAALPGFLTPEVLDDWRARYRYPSKNVVPNDAAGPWTWRLANFLDYDYDLLRGYAEDGFDRDAQLQEDNGLLIAQRPAFAYNGFAVGGSWELVSAGGVMRPAARFSWAHEPGSPGNGETIVNRTISTITRPTEQVIFCAAADLPVGFQRSIPDDQPGWHLATLPIMGETRAWGRHGLPSGSGPGEVGSATGDQTTVEVLAQLTGIDRTAVPLARHTNVVPVFHADNSVTNETPGALDDQRKWIDDADRRDWTFVEGSPP